MKKKLLFLIGLCLFGCQNTTPSTSISSNNDSGSVNVEPSSIESVEKIEVNLSELTDKSSIDLADAANDKYIQSVRNAFGTELETITFKKVFLDTYGIRVGSSSSAGEMKFTLKHEVTKIDIRARAYSKYDDYNKIHRTDADAKLKVGEELFPMDGIENEESTIKTYTCFIHTPVKSIQCSSLDGRVIIHGFTLYFN